MNEKTRSMRIIEFEIDNCNNEMEDQNYSYMVRFIYPNTGKAFTIFDTSNGVDNATPIESFDTIDEVKNKLIQLAYIQTDNDYDMNIYIELYLYRMQDVIESAGHINVQGVGFRIIKILHILGILSNEGYTEYTEFAYTNLGENAFGKELPESFIAQLNDKVDDVNCKFRYALPIFFRIYDYIKAHNYFKDKIIRYVGIDFHNEISDIHNIIDTYLSKNIQANS